MKKRNAMIMGCLALVLCLILNAAPGSARAESRYAGLTAEEIVSRLTLEQKASQMVQPL